MLSKESIDVYLDKILEKFGLEASIVVGGAAINYTFRESTMDRSLRLLRSMQNTIRHLRES